MDSPNSGKMAFPVNDGKSLVTYLSEDDVLPQERATWK